MNNENDKMTNDIIIDEAEYQKLRRTALSVVQAARLLTSLEEKVIRFRLGIPESLNEQDIESGKLLNLEGTRSIEDTAKRFNMTEERVRQIIHKMHFGGRRPSKRLCERKVTKHSLERWKEYLTEGEDNLNNTETIDYAKAIDYLEKNYETYDEWKNDNAAVCKKYNLTNEELLEIISFELDYNRALSATWKEIFAATVGLKDGVEWRIRDFHREKNFSETDIRDAMMYAQHTFAKHVSRHSHCSIIVDRFDIGEQFCRMRETEADNTEIAQILAKSGVSEDNIIYRFLSDMNLTLDRASQMYTKNEDEIKSDIQQAIAHLKNEQLRVSNEQHEFFNKTIFDKPNANVLIDRHAVTLEAFDRMNLLISKEKLIFRYLFGIPESLIKEDFENGKGVKLEEPHTFGQTAAKFGITVDQVCEAFLKIGREKRYLTDDVHKSEDGSTILDGKIWLYHDGIPKNESVIPDGNDFIPDDEMFPEEYDEKQRIVITLIRLIKERLTTSEETIARFLLGIPQDLSEQDIEGGKEFNLEIRRTYEETADEFDITVERVRQIVFKLFRGCYIRSHSRRKRLRDYLD